MANYDDTSSVTDHSHYTGIDESGFVKDRKIKGFIRLSAVQMSIRKPGYFTVR